MSERKPDGVRTGRAPYVHQVGWLRADGICRGPELPEGFKWSERTEEWYLKWRYSPQSQLMIETDWEFLLETAFIHNMLWSTSMRVDKQGNFYDLGPTPAEAKGLAGEIRIRLEKLGGTLKDRGSLGMKIGTSEKDAVQQAEEVARSAVDYRKMLEE